MQLSLIHHYIKGFSTSALFASSVHADGTDNSYKSDEGKGCADEENKTPFCVINCWDGTCYWYVDFNGISGQISLSMENCTSDDICWLDVDGDYSINITLSMREFSIRIFSSKV